MPISETGIGYSDVTPDKQDGFRKYINLHIRITQSTFSNFKSVYRYEKKYYYIDCTAGCGKDPLLLDGSPIIFKQSISKHNIDYSAYLIDCGEANCNDLSKIEMLTDKNISIINDDYQNAVPKIFESTDKNIYGLLYIDPNGTPDFEFLEYVSRQKKKLDILVRYNSTANKRARCAFDTGYDYLSSWVKKIDKKTIIIREPLPGDKHEWTFLFMTNAPSWGDWTKERFYDIKTPIGKQIFLKCDKTKKERLQQNDLFGVV